MPHRPDRRRGVAAILRGSALSALAAIAGCSAAQQPSDESEGESAEADSAGQSGSEYDPEGGNGLDTTSCPCGVLVNPLRAVVLEARPAVHSIRLRVEEPLGDGPAVDAIRPVRDRPAKGLDESLSRVLGGGIWGVLVLHRHWGGPSRARLPDSDRPRRPSSRGSLCTPSAHLRLLIGPRAQSFSDY